MILYHASPLYNKASIEKGGLKTCYSKTAGKAIWLHSWEMRKWARKHVAKRHKCSEDAVVFFAVVVGKEQVKKHSHGVYKRFSNVPAVNLQEHYMPPF